MNEIKTAFRIRGGITKKGGRTGLTNRLPLGLPKGGQRRKGGDSPWL